MVDIGIGPRCESPEPITPAPTSEEAGFIVDLDLKDSISTANLRLSPRTRKLTVRPVEPAYRALVPVLSALETYTTNPRRTTIAEEHHDEGYEQFWEAFGQLSPKEILYAVYALRDGPHAVHFERESGISAAAVVFALWALASTALCFWLYIRLP